MNEMTDEEVFGKSATPVEMSDEEVFGPAPKAAASPSVPEVPLPKERPVEAGPRPEMTDEEVFTPPAKVPLPKSRPAEAPSLIQPTQEMPPVQEPTGAPFRAPGAKPVEGTDADLAGMLTGEQAYAERESKIAGATAARVEAEARLAAAKQRQSEIHTAMPRRGTTGQQRRLAIDDEVARAEENFANASRGLSEAERSSPPTQEAGASAARGAATNIMAGVPEMIAGAARIPDALGTDIAKYPAGLVDKIRQLHPSDPARGEEFTQKIGEGAGSMVPFIVTGIVGKALGAPQAAVSAVSGGLQNAESYYREAEGLGDKGYKKALSYVTGFAGGATEGLGSGRVMDQLDKLSGGGVKRYVGAVIKSAGEEGLQEGMQQLYDNIAKYGLWGKDPGDITKDVATNALVGATLGAATAGLLGAPTIVSGRRDLKTEAGVPIPNQETVTPEQVAQQVSASGIQVEPPVTPPAPVNDPGGPTQPIPTATPVTTTNEGIQTTTTLHGPSEAYTVTTDATGKPTLEPTTGTYEWANMVNEQAQTLYPSPSGVGLSIEAMAFQNGAHGDPISTGLPLDTPIDQVTAAYNAGQQMAPPDMGMAAERSAADERSVPTEGLYSRLQAWVQERGPLNATAQRWISLLKRGEFTREEASDLGLPGWISGQTGKVSKEDVLSFLSANAAPIVEVTRRPFTKEEGQRQINAIRQTNPEAFDPVTGVPDLTHPLIEPIVENTLNPRKDSEWARYEAQTTPGPRQSYTEITMHLPSRNPEGADTSQTDLDFSGGHYAEPNELVTIRTTVRTGLNGEKIAVLEEVQSDLHQEGKKYGYGVPIDGEYMTAIEKKFDAARLRSDSRDWTNTLSVADMRLAVAAGVVTQEEANRYIGELKKVENKFVPDTPFKEAWKKLGFVRFLMWAAQNNINVVAWVDADEQMRRYAGGTTQQVATRRAGMQNFYNRELTATAKKWSKKLGGTMGYTTIPQVQYEVKSLGQIITNGIVVGETWGVFAPNNARPLMTTTDRVYAEEYAQKNSTEGPRFRSIQLPQSALDTINMGMPSYSAKEGVPTSPGAAMDEKTDADPMTKDAIRPLVEALNSLIKSMKLGIGVKVSLHAGKITYKDEKGKTRVRPDALGIAQYLGIKENKNETMTAAVIRISMGNHAAQNFSAAGIWATMVHELGHLVMWKRFMVDAPPATQLAVLDAYKTYFAKMHPQLAMTELLTMQSNAVFIMENLKNPQSPLKLGQLPSDKQEYWTGFSEWFAEQFAKWATTQEKPLSRVEKFFKGLANLMKDYLKAASDMFGMQFEPAEAITAYLDSFMESEQAPVMGPTAATQADQETIVKNAAQMEPEDTPAPAQTETAGGSDGINGAFDGRPPKEAQEAKAYADKFNWMYKWFVGLPQLAAKNLHIASLQTYVETVSIAQLTKQQIMIEAQEVLRKWNALGGKQADAVSLLLDDVQNMEYLSDDEKKNKVARHPTLAELQKMAQKYGVTQAGLAVFGEIGKSFQNFLTRYQAVLVSEANKIADETRRDLQLARIDKQIRALRSKPYFPAMRFGSYTLHIRNAAGQTIHFETVETKRQQRQAARALRSQLASGDTLQQGFLDRSVRPMLGMPTQLLELMAEKLSLNQTQRDALDQLKFELSPSQSFKHRFQHKKRIEGYSRDFQRVYANYFFHGANHLMKTKYADVMRGLIKMTRAEVEKEPNIVKREQIQAYMQNHIDNWLDPKPDWAAVRSLAFLWQLAFSPAAAAQNLTQTLLTSYPFLANHFGDISAMGALMKAGRDFQTFYTKTTLAGQSNFVQQALFQGMADGIIKETQAPELAGYADGNVLAKGWGGNELQRQFTKFNEAAAFMFEMAEQVNRRLVFRAALQLALDNPNAKYVKQAVAKRALLYQQVRGNMTEAQAAAYVAAYDATATTQFQYGKEFAPRVLKGRARAVLVFKTFIQSYCFFLISNGWGTFARAILIMAYLGGFMGVPGADDLQEWLRVIGWQLFKKDFKLDHEARKWIIELLGKDNNGADIADMMLHGASRKGYGIPAALDMLFGSVGIDTKFPVFDRSRAVSGGTILPIELGKIFGPPLQSTEKAIAEQGAKASGAIFGVGFAAYQAMRDQQLSWDDSKRWDRVMPRAMSSVAKAWRAYNEEGARTKTGSQIVKYNPRDPYGMAEIVGIGMGYTPYRQNIEWEKALARQDAVKLWEIRNQGLMRQFGNAVLGKDQAEKGRVLESIRTFNKELPQEAKGFAITSESLKQSVEKKAETRIMQEKGLSTKKRDIPVMRAEDKLYPESQREFRRVPRGLTP